MKAEDALDTLSRAIGEAHRQRVAGITPDVSEVGNALRELQERREGVESLLARLTQAEQIATEELERLAA